MKISVKAKPKSKKEYVKKLEGANFVVAVSEVPEKGKANQAIIKALADFLQVPVSSVILISGQALKQKVFEVPLTLEIIEKLPESEGQMKLL